MKKRAWIALLLTGTLAACALEPRGIESPPETRIIVQPVPISESGQLLDHATRIRKLEARELAAERDTARDQFRRDKSDFNRLHYALVLALLPPANTSAMVSAIQDDTELIALIEPVIARGGSGSASAGSDLRALAMLLHNLVSERRKVREQLRDTLARLVHVRKEDSRDAEMRALRARVEELENTLSALKSIDRSVNRRSEPERK